MTTTHVLKYNAAPYTAQGELVYPADTNITRGPGRAKCACGALSPELANGAQRRAWFKDHKAAPEVETEVEVQDEIPLDPEPEVTPEPEPEEAEDEAEEDEDEAEEAAPEVTRTLAFKKTKDLAAHFWRYLGRDGVRRLADTGVLGQVQVQTHAKDHTLTISGATEADVDEAVALIKRYWAEAVETGKEWKKTDPAWLARPREGLALRNASFHMMGEYYKGYADTFAESILDSLI